ncbi:uncharacterized protein LOC123037111 [Drosophila rhopaloa]|uniref:Uncharacterized protein n=1 Tax=Drosophila rhopaloa TaxID=1041015 RepID=A0ABM5J143_DRORH|nr:uncharacterized protein LOC123037111 [Drosophila rhopaloa]
MTTQINTSTSEAVSKKKQSVPERRLPWTTGKPILRRHLRKTCAMTGTGPISLTAPRNVSAFSTRVTCGLDDSLDHLHTKFWQTTRRDNRGNYVVMRPLRDPEHSGSELASSRSFALAQFLCNEQCLKRDPSLKARYDSVIQEYLDLGHMAEIPLASSSATYYLPQHDSTTTKVRVAFNSSSPSANGTSLNDILYAGPVLQSDQSTIQILKWRYFRFVFNADIEKMYLQIWVDPKHTPLHRILFRWGNPRLRVEDSHFRRRTRGGRL